MNAEGLLYISVETDDEESREVTVNFRVGQQVPIPMGCNYVTKITPQIDQLEIIGKYYG